MKKLILTVIFLLLACTKFSKKEEEQLIHAICIVDTLDNEVNQEMVNNFKNWHNNARFLVGSSFVIINGDYQKGYKTILSISIPQTYGAPLRKSMDRYIKNCTETILKLNSKSEPVRIGEFRQKTQRDIIQVFDIRKTRYYNFDIFNDTIGSEPVHLVVLLDLSSSKIKGNPHSVKDILEIYWNWVIHSYYKPGSTFEIFLIGTNYSTSKKIFSTIQSSNIVFDNLITSLTQEQILFNSLNIVGTDNASAILEGIKYAYDIVNERKGAKILLILSDGLQISGVFNFEVYPNPSFIDFATNNFPMDLSDWNILMIGLHSKSFETVVPSKKQPTYFEKAKIIWEELFEKYNSKKTRIYTDLRSLITY